MSLPHVLQLATLRAGDWEAVRFVSAGSRLSTNKSSLSCAGVVTEEEEGGIAVWFLFKSRYTQAWEGARGAEGLTELQARDQSPAQPGQVRTRCEVTGDTYTTAAFSLS